MSYNASDPTAFTFSDCEAAVGRSARLHLTGEIVSAEESETGPYVRFTPYENWGMNTNFGLDLDAFILGNDAYYEAVIRELLPPPAVEPLLEEAKNTLGGLKEVVKDALYREGARLLIRDKFPSGASHG